jgi:hypothetical protein
MLEILELAKYTVLYKVILMSSLIPGAEVEPISPLVMDCRLHQAKTLVINNQLLQGVARVRIHVKYRH